MESPKPETNSVSEKKKALQKKGGIYLAIGIVALLISILMYNAGIDGGIIYALISLAWVVFLIMGIVNLIRGYSGKK